MAAPFATTLTKIRASLDEGYGLVDVDSTDACLVLRLVRDRDERVFRLARDEVRALVGADLLDALAASATRADRGRRGHRRVAGVPA